MDIISLNDTLNKLYFVGGVVRDELLGKKSLDVDIVYEGNAIEDCSCLGEVLRVNLDFGTIRVRIDKDSKLFQKCFSEEHNFSFSSMDFDIASSRLEKYEKKGHLPQVENIGCDLKKDVLRRDFTVNSLYKSVVSGEILDFVGGIEDLKNKKLRVLHKNSFIDDPTRILRALKFKHRFGFELDSETQSLRDEYLKNINYDMCYKRIKKELIETLGLNSQEIFEEFINSGIYKLVTPNKVALPEVNIQNLVDEYIGAFDFENSCVWLIYVGILGDLSRLELTKKEQKILDDYSELVDNVLNDDFEIYKAFENCEVESLMIYAVLKDEKVVKHYLNDLRGIKIQTTGEVLNSLGYKPSPIYKEIFDFLLKCKLNDSEMTLEDEKIVIEENFSHLKK